MTWLVKILPPSLMTFIDGHIPEMLALPERVQLTAARAACGYPGESLQQPFGC